MSVMCNPAAAMGAGGQSPPTRGSRGRRAWASRTGQAEVTPDFCEVRSSVGQEDGQNTPPVVSLFPHLLSSWGDLQARDYTRVGIFNEIERCGIFVKRSVWVGCGFFGVGFLFLAEGVAGGGGGPAARPLPRALRGSPGSAGMGSRRLA